MPRHGDLKPFLHQPAPSLAPTWHGTQPRTGRLTGGQSQVIKDRAYQILRRPTATRLVFKAFPRLSGKKRLSAGDTSRAPRMAGVIVASKPRLVVMFHFEQATVATMLLEDEFES